MSIISVKGVSKVFRQRNSKALLKDHVRELVTKPSQGGFYALRDVSFEISKQESVAVIGANGAGKSTLLALVCGLAEPDEGSIHVGGSLAPLLELGSGFHPDLTGRENLSINAALLGMNEAQVNERFESILEFSELGRFIDEPLRAYSAGMVLRLAFAVATHCDPGILIIDEVLGVGDSNFQNKCHQRIEQLRADGNTFLVVSHSTDTVQKFCDRAIWLHHGVMVADGPVATVVDGYNQFMTDPAQPLPEGFTSRMVPPVQQLGHSTPTGAQSKGSKPKSRSGH